MSGGSKRTLTGLETAQSHAKKATSATQKMSVNEERFFFMICALSESKVATDAHANQ